MSLTAVTEKKISQGKEYEVSREAEEAARVATSLQASLKAVEENLRRIQLETRKREIPEIESFRQEMGNIMGTLGKASLCLTDLTKAVAEIAQRMVQERFISLFSEKDCLPHIIILGKPAAGKGTLSKLLSQKLGYVHISIGDIHRSENEKGSVIGLRIRACVEREDFFGKEMVEITRKLLDRKFEEILKGDQRFILDNFPTAVGYLPYINEVIDRYQLTGRIVLIVPEISEVESVSRLFNRVICSNQDCLRIYNLSKEEFRPEKEGKCDGCGSELKKRIDEREEDIPGKFRSYETKLSIYKHFIKPVIDELSGKIECFVLDNVFIRKVFLDI